MLGKNQKRSQPHFLLLDVSEHHKESFWTSVNLALGREKVISRRKENIFMCSNNSNYIPSLCRVLLVLAGKLGSLVMELSSQLVGTTVGKCLILNDNQPLEVL